MMKVYFNNQYSIDENMCVYKKGRKLLQLTNFSVKNFLLSGTIVVIAGDVVFSLIREIDRLKVMIHYQKMIEVLLPEADATILIDMMKTAITKGLTL